MPSFTGWDVALIVVVAAHATFLAYLHYPRAKALLYCIPIPFTLATLALGAPVGVTHVLGMALMLGFMCAVYLLHARARLPIVPAIALCAASYCLIAGAVARVAVDGEPAFWAALAAVFALGLGLYLRLPHRAEQGHTSPLPVPVKFLGIVCVIGLLVLIKQRLQGFMTMFPMVGVIAAYEARYSLWTLLRQIPLLMLAVTPMLMLCRLLQPHLGVGWALACGWVAFLSVLIPLSVRRWREGAGGVGRRGRRPVLDLQGHS